LLADTLSLVLEGARIIGQGTHGSCNDGPRISRGAGFAKGSA
jgi:hypothetical protein